MVATGSVVHKKGVVGKGTGEGGDRFAQEGRQAVSPSGADVGSAEVERGSARGLVRTAANGAAKGGEH